MNILITGATGFIGSYLVANLQSKNNITVLSRNHKRAQKVASNTKIIDSLDTLENLDHFDVVINLAGEPILKKRWTKKQKFRILNSRVLIIKKLGSLIKKSKKPPKVIISASSVGIYKQKHKDPSLENDKLDNTFAANVCKKIEDSFLPVQNHSRVCILRLGLVIGKSSQIVKALKPLFLIGLGAKVGDSTQIIPWVHVSDVLRAINHLVEDKNLSGAFNLVASQNTTSFSFYNSLAKSLKRPCFFWVPNFVLYLIYGKEASKDVLLKSQKISSQKLMDSGFSFHRKDINLAFK